MEYTSLQKEIGFETYQHIWNVQRFLSYCIQDTVSNANEILFLKDNDSLVLYLICVCSAKDRNDIKAILPFYDSQVFEICANTFELFEQQDLVHYRKRVNYCINALVQRMVTHDQSKLGSIEVDLFTEYTPKLKNTEFGSDEYKGFLEQLKPALDNHYAHNRHHPEHYENGVRGMTLIDLIEMVCDWTASSLRNKQGSFESSLKICKERFNIDNYLANLLSATYYKHLDDKYGLTRDKYEMQTV